MIFRTIIPGEAVPMERPRWDPRHRRIYTPNKTVAAKRELARHLYAAWPGEPAAGRLAVRMEFYLPGGNHGDWDNYAKLVCDAGNKICWRDDRQIIEAHVVLNLGEPGKTVLSVEAAE